jgi:hypothetical protein
MFQLHKKWQIFILKLFFIAIDFYGFKSLVHLNLHPICKHWGIAHKLDHFFFFFPFFTTFFTFLLFVKFLCQQIIHPQVHSIYLMTHIQKKIVTLTTYSWDVESTHDLLNSKYFKKNLK